MDRYYLKGREETKATYPLNKKGWRRFIATHAASGVKQWERSTKPIADAARGWGSKLVHCAWRALAITGERKEADKTPPVFSSAIIANSGGQSVDLRSWQRRLFDTPNSLLKVVSDFDVSASR